MPSLSSKSDTTETVTFEFYKVTDYLKMHKVTALRPDKKKFII
jgi:hypothetical protein